MKIAGRERNKRPNWMVLHLMRAHSTRAWVYRGEQGWVFAELTPDEVAEFNSYTYGITIPRMRVRLPYDSAVIIVGRSLDSGHYANWFMHCTVPPIHPLLPSKFHIRQLNTEAQVARFRHPPVELGDYETWLWADEISTCRHLGCKITVHNGVGWESWGVPTGWRAPAQYKERAFIYAFVNDHTRHAYIGQTDNLERRLVEHLRDTKHSAKVALLQSIRATGREPELITLEEVSGERASERERYWTAYYNNLGYTIVNQDYKSVSGHRER